MSGTEEMYSYMVTFLSRKLGLTEFEVKYLAINILYRVCKDKWGRELILRLLPSGIDIVASRLSDFLLIIGRTIEVMDRGG